MNEDNLKPELRLLSNLIGLGIEKIEEALKEKKNYRYIPKKKKDGSIRKIYEPPKELKKLQRFILRRFFYKIALTEKSKEVMMGSVRGRSYILNAKVHCHPDAHFIRRLDLKNAFPTVTRTHLKKVLGEIFLEEVKRYQEQKSGIKIEKKQGKTKYSYRLPLFPVRRVKWFRKFIREQKHEQIMKDFLELILDIVTYKGIMAQGLPTSSWLLNVVISHSGLIEKLLEKLKEKGIVVKEGGPLLTLYVDDFTIASSRPIRYSLIDFTKLLIKQETIFKTNDKKEFYYRRKEIAPLVTGLRIRKMPQVPGNKALVSVIKEMAKSLGIDPENQKDYIEKELKKRERKARYMPGIPRKKLRLARVIIHWACDEAKSGLMPVAEGHINNLRSVYGNYIPNQVLRPIRKYYGVLKERKEKEEEEKEAD